MEFRCIITGVVITVAAASGVLFAFELKEFFDLKQQKSQVDKRIEGLAVRRDHLNSLSDAIEKNGADDVRVERVIREKLGLIKEGEKIFIFSR